MIGHGLGNVRLDEGVHPHANHGRLRGRAVVEQPMSITCCTLVAVVRNHLLYTLLPLSGMIDNGLGIVRFDEADHPHANL